MNKLTLRPAIAMIELIFAIVIMGIILMSAPMLISTAAKSGFVAIQQENINEAASQVNMVMGYPWDENPIDDDYISPILVVSSGDSELDEDNSTGIPTCRRPGTPAESYRAFVRADGLRLSASTLDNNDTGDIAKDDIDDFDDDTSLQEIAPSDVDYIEDSATLRINTTVRYISDTADYNANTLTFSPDFNTSTGTISFASSTNIKRITVNLTSVGAPDELQKEIILHAFSCNIGEYNLEERDVN